MYTTYLAIGIIIYVAIRLVTTKGIMSPDKKPLSQRFWRLTLFSFLAVVVSGFNDAIRFGADVINFYDWLYNSWLFLRYFVQIPLLGAVGYHFYNYIYENEMTSLWNLKINHFVLIILGLLSWIVWQVFHIIGLAFLRAL